MGYAPEKWTNLKSVLVMKYMGAMLSGYEEDVSSSVLLLALGEEKYRQFYPEYTLMTSVLSFSVVSTSTHTYCIVNSKITSLLR